ncbi:U3 small nucleolar RNA-associated protein 6 homolog [Artemia franciscana]|uniref:U3 small nucleolar RNA-associated protein 6 homolog n=1 Tax=Artemia franciscana TaxID=6661 RepID=A0AA88KWM1_ARTSF|nr:hypothetical protein QYM36_017136 [Artemia franciscana]
MAEFVELRLEEMLGELEQTERVGLFSTEEVRSIIKRRRDFEYKIQRFKKRKEDYLKYIQYEISIYKLLKLRRKKTGYSFKKEEIDHAISNRIGTLFRFCVFRFQDDIKLWLSYVDFCKQVNWTNRISKIFVKMLAVHNDKPYLWLMAAKWEFEENVSAENARAILLRGLQFLPQSKELYLESFRLELLFVDRLKKRKQVLGVESKELNEETEDDVLKGKLAQFIYSAAIEKIPESRFIVQFLGIVKTFTFAKWLEDIIMNDLITNHSTDEHTWDTLARREIEGRNYQAEIVAGEDSKVTVEEENTSQIKLAKFSVRFQNCCDTYEKGTEVIGTPLMYQLYLGTLLELRNQSKHLNIVIPRLFEVLEVANDKGYLTESLYETWICLTKDLKKWNTLDHILASATKNFPKSAKFWLERLQSEFDVNLLDSSNALFMIDTGSEPMQEDRSVVDTTVKYSEDSEDSEDSDTDEVTYELPKVFWEAVKALGDTKESLQIWQFLSRHLIEKGKEARKAVQKLFDESLKRKPVISKVLNVTYLEWTFKVKGLLKARELYRKLAIQPPFSLELHEKMILLENKTADKDMIVNVRYGYDCACDQFGKGNPNIWMSYVRFERVSGDPMKIPAIYKRAQQALEGDVATHFQNEFVLLSTGSCK